MNVLISPNAFKGTISAQKAGEIISDFIADNFIGRKIIISPVADGGDGTCQLLTQALNLEKIRCWSLNAYGLPIPSFFGWDQLSAKAYIDVSTASGLGTLNPKSLHPNVATTFGTGILIREAISYGAKEIVLGLGGSATIDLGIGILASLGLDFLDQKGRSLTPFSPDYLTNIRHIQRSPRTPKVNFICLCDVKNLLFGNAGAIPVFGPQKGLKEEEFLKYQNLCERLINTLYLKSTKEFEDQEGFGAAGGIAAGLNAFFPTELKIGASYFFEQVDLAAKLEWADLVITGEGRYDSQSKEGKASYELLRLAKEKGKKVGLITSGNEGSTDGFDFLVTLPSLDFNTGKVSKRAEENLRKALDLSIHSDFWT